MIFRFLITLCLSISFVNVSAQDEELQCVRVNDFSVEKRNQNYPFNKAKRIVFTSFEEDHRKLLKNKDRVYEKDEIISYMHGEIMQEYFDSLKLDFARYNPDDFEEKVDLNEEQKNEFTDLIFNFGNNHNNAVMWATKCYMPRNAILFFDDRNNLFEFIEICFECSRYRTSDDNVDLNNNCAENYIY